MSSIKHLLEQPIVPIYRYDPNSPPFNIPVNHEVIGTMTGFIASTIANEIGDKAYHNVARMLCYNLLVDCNFQNEDMIEVYNLIVGAICLNIAKNGCRNITKVIQDDVSSILTLYTSNLINRYNELKSSCPPQLVNAAQQNVPTFNNLKQEILSMYNNQGMPAYPNTPMQTGMQIYMGSNGVPVYENGMPVHPHDLMRMQQQFPNQGMPMQPQYQNHGMPMQQQFPNPGIPMQPQYQNHGMPMHQHNPRVPIQQPNVGSNNVAMLRENKHQNLNKPLERPVHVQQTIVPLVQETELVKVEKTFSIDKLQITGGSEMERSKHRIQILGQNLVLPSESRHREFNESVDDFCNIVEDKDKSVLVLPTSVYPSIIGSCNLDSAVNTTKINKLMSKNANTSKSIYRCFCLITEPIAYTDSTKMSAIMQQLSKSDNLDDIARALGKIAKSIYLESIVGDDEKVLNFITEVNIKLTEKVNSFLKNELRLDLRIEDFIEDGDGLEKFLNKKDNAYRNAYVIFGQKVTAWLFQGDDKEFVELTLCELDLPKSVTVGFMNTLCSITLVDVTSQELGVELDHKSYYIDNTTAPLIYNIADTLHLHKVDEELSTLDILITCDGVRYRLYRDYLGDGKYLISKL